MIAALLLFACSTGPAAPSPVAGDLPFPHPDGYDAATAHGGEARTFGADVCLGCHRAEAGAAATCESCHAGYPHVEGWLAGAAHGEGLGGVAGAERRDACTSCHGATGLAAPACTACHGSYPHPVGWVIGGAHGAYAIERGSATASCGSCHGTALEGGVVAPACTACHADWPHPAGWSDPSRHAAADLTTCGGCHGADGSGGTSDVACARCHATYPHAEGWPVGHVSVAAKVGEAVCLDCHDAGEGPSAMPAACGAVCHGVPQ